MCVFAFLFVIVIWCVAAGSAAHPVLCVRALFHPVGPPAYTDGSAGGYVMLRAVLPCPYALASPSAASVCECRV
eukprot:scaffold4212_cov122-Isochrysis_galbana.AAC.19